MAPAYRPFTCITFHCERIESQLSSTDLERIGALERGLRDSCRDLDGLFGHRMTQGLLLRYARRLRGEVEEIIPTSADLKPRDVSREGEHRAISKRSPL